MLAAPSARRHQEQLDFQASVLKVLVAAPVNDAIGIALSYLLHSAYHAPDVLRRCLNEPVIKQGFRGVSLIHELQRVAQS